MSCQCSGSIILTKMLEFRALGQTKNGESVSFRKSFRPLLKILNYLMNTDIGFILCMTLVINLVCETLLYNTGL